LGEVSQKTDRKSPNRTGPIGY